LFSKKQTAITRYIALIYPVALPPAKHEAVKMHIEGMIEDNMPIPENVTMAEYIAIAV
jgi:hypothetical protein